MSISAFLKKKKRKKRITLFLLWLFFVCHPGSGIIWFRNQLIDQSILNAYECVCSCGGISKILEIKQANHQSDVFVICIQITLATSKCVIIRKHYKTVNSFISPYDVFNQR